MAVDFLIETVDASTNNTVGSYSFSGSKSLYEETFDGTHAGWSKFRKDIAQCCGVKGDSWVIEIKKGDSFIELHKPEELNDYLEQSKVHIRIKISGGKSKSSKKDNKEKDVEKGNMDVEDGHPKKERSCCATLIRLPFLILLYLVLFAFWLVGLIFAILIDLIWCPIKIICPCKRKNKSKFDEENRFMSLHLLRRRTSEEDIWFSALGSQTSFQTCKENIKMREFSDCSFYLELKNNVELVH